MNLKIYKTKAILQKQDFLKPNPNTLTKSKSKCLVSTLRSHTEILKKCKQD